MSFCVILEAFVDEHTRQLRSAREKEYEAFTNSPICTFADVGYAACRQEMVERSANVQEFRVAQQRKMSAQRGLSLLPVYRIMSAYIRPWCQGEQQSSEGTCEESWGAALAGMVSSARVVQSWEAARDCRVCKRRSTTCSRRLETYRFILSQR